MIKFAKTYIKCLKTYFQPINASSWAFWLIWLISLNWLKRVDPWNVKAGRTRRSDKSKSCLGNYATNLHQTLVRVDFNAKKPRFVIFRPINASYSALQFIWSISKDWLKGPDPWNVKAGRTRCSHKSKTCLCYYYTTNLHQTSVRVFILLKNTNLLFLDQ